MTTYLLHGFDRQDHSKNVCILVDCDDDDPDHPLAIAKKIVGDSICYVACQNLDVAVPDDCKGVIFNSDAELYARMPALAPPPRRHRRARAK